MLVFPKRAISTVHQERNFRPIKFPKLEKICKPTNETMAFLVPSQFSKDVNSSIVSFNSSNLLAEQLLDLEVRLICIIIISEKKIIYYYIKNYVKKTNWNTFYYLLGKENP